VCGGRGALGSAIADTLSTRGDRVVIADRDDVDLTDAGAVETFWNALDETPRWVVNAAGGFRAGTVAESEPEDLRFLAEINVAATWWSCRAAARRMKTGAIVNVAADAGLTGGKGKAGYAASKAAVVRLTEVLALELAGTVRVNAVVPSLIATPANAAQGISGGTPPEQIAEVIAFLLSDAAAPVTGALLPV
jgi:NAD(P)-dependent dehydrogenase (short-subunit alcohol dehydrogenase family)